MHKLLIFMILIMSNLVADYLIVDDAPIGSVSNNIVVNNMRKEFSPNSLGLGVNSVVEQLPIYIKSDSSQNISMVLSGLNKLKNSTDQEEIESSFFYRTVEGHEVAIQEGVPFILSRTMNHREGNSIAGYIIIKAMNISSMQTVGLYWLDANIQVALDNRLSRLAQLSVSGSVPLVAVAGFNDNSEVLSGQKFYDESVNYGKFKFGQENIIMKELFVKSNSLKSFKISFAASDLIHKTYPEHRIKMNYFYAAKNQAEQAITNNYFTAITGKNDGTQVGQMIFKTEAIKNTQLAGEYQANINITITLE